MVSGLPIFERVVDPVIDIDCVTGLRVVRLRERESIRIETYMFMCCIDILFVPKRFTSLESASGYADK